MLELLAQAGELSVSEVARKLGYNRANSHRYLATLRDMGYVEKNAAARYRLTFKILEIGARITDRFEIRRIARPHMRELAATFNETVNLGYWDGQAILNIDKIDSSNVLRTNSAIGAVMPAHCTSQGKCVLAFLPANELDIYLAHAEFESFLPNTITSVEQLQAELATTRSRGYAIDDEEWLMGIRCVAAPIFDYTGRPSYALSIAGPAIRMQPEIVARVQAKLREVCAALTRVIGKQGGAI